MSRQSAREKRSTAEWVTLAISSAILLVVVGLVVLQLFSTRDPAAPQVTIEAQHRAPDGSHHVEVAVTNDGDETAANVQVSATLTAKGETIEAEQVVDFLAGGESETVVFVFADDPKTAELTVEIGSFASA